MTSPVVYNPQRDAWKAIRGFYYQVELTVIRWLELQADTILYCEYGFGRFKALGRMSLS
jgi:hypothetical protein